MKKLLTFGLLSVAVALAAEQPAHAWVNSRFSIGLNWNYQAGANSFMWGLYRNGQVPSPADYGMGGMGPGCAMPMAQPFPYFGGAAQPSAPAAAQPGPAAQQAYYGNNNIYQAVSYQNGGYGDYSGYNGYNAYNSYAPMYYVPSYYGYGYGYGY